MSTNLQIKRETSELYNPDMTSLNSLLSLLHGKNDSICKLFNKEIKVDISKLKSLNKMMLDKLSTHDVEAIATTIDS